MALVMLMAGHFASAQGTAGVSGRVVLTGPARPLDGLRVSLRFVGTQPWVSGVATTQVAQSVMLDARGRYAFLNVAAGIYVVQATDPGVIPAEWGALAPGLAGRALVVRPGDDRRDLTVTVMARPMICGRVFGVDGRPVAGASVHAWKTDAQNGLSQGGAGPDGIGMGGNTTADGEGRYRFDRLQMDDYVVGGRAGRPAERQTESGAGVRILGEGCGVGAGEDDPSGGEWGGGRVPV